MTESSGEWKEERLWVMRSIERLEAAEEKRIAEIAVMRALNEKQRTDLNTAHSRIRELKTRGLKEWASMLAGSAAFAIAVLRLMEFLWRR